MGSGHNKGTCEDLGLLPITDRETCRSSDTSALWDVREEDRSSAPRVSESVKSAFGSALHGVRAVVGSASDHSNHRQDRHQSDQSDGDDSGTAASLRGVKNTSATESRICEAEHTIETEKAAAAAAAATSVMEQHQTLLTDMTAEVARLTLQVCTIEQALEGAVGRIQSMLAMRLGGCADLQDVRNRLMQLEEDNLREKRGEAAAATTSVMEQHQTSLTDMTAEVSSCSSAGGSDQGGHDDMEATVTEEPQWRRWQGRWQKQCLTCRGWNWQDLASCRGCGGMLGQTCNEAKCPIETGG